jgi:hypothetical protein
MDKFTINRSLCEVEFLDKDLNGEVLKGKDLKSVDVDVMEYVWVKIREYWLTYQKTEYSPPTNYVEIGFCEIRDNLGSYNKKRLTDSVIRLGDLIIVTNKKSFDPSDYYHFTFKVSEDKKSFKVYFDNKLFKLFDKPKKYCEYDQSDMGQFKEKYTKLLFKFLIGYKKFGLMKKSMFIDSDVLMKIMNIHTKKPISKIQYHIFQSSFRKISENTGLDVELIKDTKIIKDGLEVIKYIVKFNGYEGGEEHGINKFLYGFKKDFKNEIVDNGRIPVFYLKYVDDVDDTYYIDTDYKLVGIHKGKHNTKSVLETYKLLNEWYDKDKLGVRIDYLDKLPKIMKKHSFLSDDELKKRGLYR